MPASQLNRIEVATKISEKLDQRMIDRSVTGWMTENAGDFEFRGNGVFRIPSIHTSGLGDYRKDLGYPIGSVTMTGVDYTLEYDRGRSFLLDAMDVDESNFVVKAARVMTTFNDENIVPEMDAVRFAKLAGIATAQSNVESGYTPAAATIYSKIVAAMYAVKEKGFDEVVAHVSGDVLAALASSTELNRYLRVDDWEAGRIYTKVQFIDDMPLIMTPSRRFYTAVDLLDGVTAGEEAGGYQKASGAADINFMVIGRKVPAAVEKHETKTILAPGTHTLGDNWFLGTRVYHDLLVLDSRKDGVFMNTK